MYVVVYCHSSKRFKPLEYFDDQAEAQEFADMLNGDKYPREYLALDTYDLEECIY